MNSLSRFPLRRGRVAGTIGVHVVGALVLSLGWTSTGALLFVALGRRPGQVSLLRFFLASLLTSFPLCVFLYSRPGCIYAFTYYREMREREEQQVRLAAQLAEARLSALRMQLNPHFLFNSLNAITVLVERSEHSGCVANARAVERRFETGIAESQRQEVTLDEELQFIEKYLAIEQVRFSDRLRINWAIDSDLA